MQQLLISVDAPGPAEFIAPVLPELKKKYKVLLVTVKESPAAILQKFNPTRCDSEADAEPIYREFRPDILLIAMSSLVLGPYINLEFAKLGKADGKKIILFQDFWANHRWPMNYKMLKTAETVLVPDDIAKGFIVEDGYEGKITVTGSPAFEKIQKINVAQERARLRKKLKIPEESFVILHCGTGTPQSWQEDEITFKFLAEAVKNFKNAYPDTVFISRPHPRDEKPDRYFKLAPNLGLLDTSSVKLTDELLPVANAVVAMYSTNLIHACYLRIPAISILLPNAGKKRLEKISLADFPPNAIGATIGIYEPGQKTLLTHLEKIQNDANYRSILKFAQEKFFPIGKKSAVEKVLKALLFSFAENPGRPTPP